MAERPTESRHDYIVIGAGALGMTVALRLLEAGNSVHMFQVYSHDRGQNYSVQLAERLVRHLQST